MGITIGKLISKSKGGHQYGVQLYAEGNSLPQSLKFENDNQLHIGDYVLGQYSGDEFSKHCVFHYHKKFSPNDISHWLTVFSIDKEVGGNPLITDIVSENVEQILAILKQGKEAIPLAVMFLEWGCNHFDSLSSEESHLMQTYDVLCDYISQIMDKPKQMGLAIAPCIRFINTAWDEDWFSSEKNLLLKVHTLDKLVSKATSIQEDDCMAVFYSRRINIIASFGETILKSFLAQTPALLYAGINGVYADYLSKDARDEILSIYHFNGPTLEQRIASSQLDEIEHYFAMHPDEWEAFSTDIIQRLIREKAEVRIDFIRKTYRSVSELMREAYLNVLLKTEIAQEQLENYIILLQELYSDEVRIDGDINEDNARAICGYFCGNVENHGNLRFLALKLWQSLRWKPSIDEMVEYLRCGLLTDNRFISFANRQSNIDLFTLWKYCRRKGEDRMVEELSSMLLKREKSWSDWDTGKELYKAGVFESLPFRLLFKPGTTRDMIVAELNKLKPAEYIGYLDSNTDRELVTDVTRNLWLRLLKTVKLDQPMPSASESADGYRSRFFSMPDDEVSICMLKEWDSPRCKSLKVFISSILRDSINESIAKEVKAFFGQDKYVSHSEVERFIGRHHRYFDTLLIAKKIGLIDLIVDSFTADICGDLPGLEKLKEKSNRKFINNHLSEHFSVRRHELIEEQKKAVLCDEDNTLVINSAGGGKSTLIEAKARYLVNNLNVSPKDILVLAFNRSVAEELAGKMKDVGVECGTFHKIAQNIIAKKKGYGSSIFEIEDGLAVFFDLMKKDPLFKRVVSDYSISTFYYGIKAPYEYKTKDDYENAIIEYNSKRRKRSLDKLFPEYKDMDGRTVACKSIQECEICDFLGSHGILFKYESFYEHQVYSLDRKRYQPDFAIYRHKDDKTPLLYIEHIGINKEGECAPWIDKYEYEKKREWAKETHKKNETILVETTGAEFDNHSVFTNLAQKLKIYGIDLSQTVAPPFNQYELSEIGEFCVSYVSLLKSSCQSLSDIKKKVQSKDSQYFLDKMIGRFEEEYDCIKKKDDRIDWDDAILEATKYLNDGSVQQTYKYILIDEFQDISVSRHRFVKALRNSETKLFCVGDDWQSIYRFTGSDLSLFADFERYTGYAERIEAGTTFRFGNPARETSSTFINQSMPCGKKVKQHDKDKVTEIKPLPYENAPVSLIKSILDVVLSEESNNGNDEKRIPKVIFLARNSPKKNKAFRYLKITHEGAKRRQKYYVSYEGKKIPFFSIHAAKGLEAENVIVLNCNEGKFGIPSQISESPLLQYVLSNPDAYPYAEERRLFYVALTRATTKTWLLYDKNRPSPFIKEIQEIISKQEE